MINHGILGFELSELDTLLDDAHQHRDLVEKTYAEFYNKPVDNQTWSTAIKSFLRYTDLFMIIWRLTGRIHSHYFLLQLVKSGLFYLVCLPVLKLITMGRTSSDLGVIMPITPKEHHMQELVELTGEIRQEFLVQLDEGFRTVQADSLG